MHLKSSTVTIKNEILNIKSATITQEDALSFFFNISNISFVILIIHYIKITLRNHKNALIGLNNARNPLKIALVI